LDYRQRSRHRNGALLGCPAIQKNIRQPRIVRKADKPETSICAGFSLSLCSHLRPALPLSLGYLSTCSSGEGSLPWLVVPTFTTLVPVENGFINAANSNLHLEIPLGAASYRQRGGCQNKILLIYDSTFWRISGNSWQAPNFRLVDAGMRVVSTDSTGGISDSRINRSNAHCNWVVRQSCFWTCCIRRCDAVAGLFRVVPDPIFFYSRTSEPGPCTN
jgi:hypothetical protein